MVSLMFFYGGERKPEMSRVKKIVAFVTVNKETVNKEMVSRRALSHGGLIVKL